MNLADAKKPLFSIPFLQRVYKLPSGSTVRAALSKEACTDANGLDDYHFDSEASQFRPDGLLKHSTAALLAL